MIETSAARSVAFAVLADALPRRWSHVSAVATRAASIAPAFGPSDGDALVSAAWLHDIGYAPDLVDTGFHPLDGARYLRGLDVEPRVVALVANHSCARIEAAERGLADKLIAEFAYEDSPIADALCYCDMTTGPDGEHVAVLGRLDEIRSRYGPDDVVTRFIERARPELVAAVERTEALLDRAGIAQPM